MQLHRFHHLVLQIARWQHSFVSNQWKFHLVPTLSTPYASLPPPHNEINLVISLKSTTYRWWAWATARRDSCAPQPTPYRRAERWHRAPNCRSASSCSRLPTSVRTRSQCSWSTPAPTGRRAVVVVAPTSIVTIVSLPAAIRLSAPSVKYVSLLLFVSIDVDVHACVRVCVVCQRCAGIVLCAARSRRSSSRLCCATRAIARLSRLCCHQRVRCPALTMLVCDIYISHSTYQHNNNNNNNNRYMARTPQPAAYVFVIDVSAAALSSGAAAFVARTVRQTLAELDAMSDARVGIITFNHQVQFYNLLASQVRIVSHILVVCRSHQPPPIR
jgi:hypothetical protein